MSPYHAAACAGHRYSSDAPLVWALAAIQRPNPHQLDVIARDMSYRLELERCRNPGGFPGGLWYRRAIRVGEVPGSNPGAPIERRPVVLQGISTLAATRPGRVW